MVAQRKLYEPGLLFVYILLVLYDDSSETTYIIIIIIIIMHVYIAPEPGNFILFKPCNLYREKTDIKHRVLICPTVR